MLNPAAEFPEKLAFLFQPARYKVLYGGRGGAKSWGIARALLIMAAQKPLRILCARELQNSMKDSVHQLLRDQIVALGLSGHYEVQNAEIRGKNGSIFIFSGLRHNVDSIKSKEAVDIVWVEEAQTVSRASWATLIPTVRKDGSEIWVSFNPELDTDETYVRFVINPPPGAVVVKIGWQDNPWFPAVLRDEMEHLKATDPDAYLTVWGGECRQTLDGAIYARELRAAAEEGRITSVRYEPAKPVHTFWDLGRRDRTSIWFAQVVGFEFRIIDFYENRGQVLSHYLKVLQGRPYVYGTDWLPHDAEHDLLASERTIAQQARAVGRNVRITPNLPVAAGIDAARTIFPNCFFDRDKCADGLNHLRRYRYDVDEHTGQFSKLPLHDDASHAADAWRYLAIGLQDTRKPAQVKPPVRNLLPVGTGQRWMA